MASANSIRPSTVPLAKGTIVLRCPRLRRRIWPALIAGGLLLPTITGQAGAQVPPEVIQSARPSVVRVLIVQDGQAAAFGSGFFVGDQGNIVTNRHVLMALINGEEDITRTRVYVELSDGTRYEVRHADGAVRSDPRSSPDLVILRAPDLPPAKVKPIVVRQGGPRVGELVVALGFSGGEGYLANPGSVTGGIRTVAGLGKVFTMSAPITHGNSGGPVIDAQGHLVGVSVGGRGEAHQLYTFAIPGQRIAELPFVDKRIPVTRKDGSPASFQIKGHPVDTPLFLFLVRRLSTEGTRANIAFNIGKRLLNERKCDAASKSFADALSYRPTAIAAYYLGFAYLVCGGHPTEAQEMAEYALSLGGATNTMYLSLLLLARTSLELRHYEYALDAAVQALEIDDHSAAGPYVILGAANYRLRRFPDARQAFHDALAIEPKNAEALEGMILTLVASGDMRSVAGYMSQLKAVDPARALRVQQQISSTS